MQKEDFTRNMVLDVSANGAVFIRDKRRKPVKGTLPCFTTNTREEAESLRVLHCKLARDGSGTYYLNDFKTNDLDSLDKAADMFRASYAGLITLTVGV